MSYLDQLIEQSKTIEGRQTMGVDIGLRKGQAYSSFYPSYEVQAPQYIYPSAYSLAQVGFRTNELVYACIGERAASVSEAPLVVYDDTGETPQELHDHPLHRLLMNPTPGLSEQEFWEIVQTYLLIAGYSVWEKEFTNGGELLHLWPMRPDWCSFLRGQQKPIRAVRYQPYGLPYQDIPASNCVIFQFFDPLWPLLKGYSPTMNVLRQIGVDNDMTDFLKIFFQEGAQFSGIFKVKQQLDEAEARRIQASIISQHGGADKWARPLVLGDGGDWTATQMNFEQMAFPSLDGRTEARICMGYRVSPLLIGAKVGIGASTYNNYKEARQSFFERVVTHDWKFLANQMWEQLLPDYEGEKYKGMFCAFDTRDVKALQEDRTAKWTRAVSAAEANVITRDMALEEMGFDPIDNAAVFVGPHPVPAGGTKPAAVDPVAPAPSNGNTQAAQEISSASSALPVTPETPPDETTAELQNIEIKKFKAYARGRLREGKPGDIGIFQFKHLPMDKRIALMAEYTNGQESTALQIIQTGLKLLESSPDAK